MVTGENISFAWLLVTAILSIVSKLHWNVKITILYNQCIKISHKFGIKLYSRCIMSKVKYSR